MLEASNRTGGHVFTFREGLADGLYADAGAEQFTEPGYERYWGYVHEFGLAHRYYPRREHMLRWIGGTLYTEEMLSDPKTLGALGLNAREIAYLRTHPFWELASLYFAPYLDSFTDEYKPFDAGLNHLDALTRATCSRRTARRLPRSRSSAGAARRCSGVARGDPAAARRAALAAEGVQAGQRQPDADRHVREQTRRSRPPRLSRHPHRAGRDRRPRHCRDGGREVTHDGDYLVSAMSAVMLRVIPFTPALPAAKAFAVHNVPYYFDSRVIFQTKSRFWPRDKVSPNMEINEDALQHVWSTCDEVDTSRGLLVGTATGAGITQAALAAYRKHYPGNRRTSRSRRSSPGRPTDGRRRARRRRIRRGSSRSSGRR